MPTTEEQNFWTALALLTAVYGGMYCPGAALGVGWVLVFANWLSYVLEPDPDAASLPSAEAPPTESRASGEVVYTYHAPDESKEK